MRDDLWADCVAALEANIAPLLEAMRDMGAVERAMMYRTLAESFSIRMASILPEDATLWSKALSRCRPCIESRAIGSILHVDANDAAPVNASGDGSVAHGDAPHGAPAHGAV